MRPQGGRSSCREIPARQLATGTPTQPRRLLRWTNIYYRLTNGATSQHSNSTKTAN